MISFHIVVIEFNKIKYKNTTKMLKTTINRDMSYITSKILGIMLIKMNLSQYFFH